MCKPLLDYGITSIIVENPYYGGRKPADQSGSCLLYAQDLFLMGGCLVLECLVLFNYLQRSNYGPLGVTGVSLGGHMSSLAGCSWPKPVSIVPCLSWTTASCVFTQGVLSGALPWNVLMDQYRHFGEETISELYKLIHSPERPESFHAGRRFAKQYPVRNQVEDPLDADHLFLSNESYIEKLQEFNEERRIKRQLDNEANLIGANSRQANGNGNGSQANGSQTNGNGNGNELKKKAEQDRIRSFINTISFNVYDSLNKTLMKSEKNPKNDDSSLTDALNFMIGMFGFR